MQTSAAPGVGSVADRPAAARCGWRIKVLWRQSGAAGRSLCCSRRRGGFARRRERRRQVDADAYLRRRAFGGRRAIGAGRRSLSPGFAARGAPRRRRAGAAGDLGHSAISRSARMCSSAMNQGPALGLIDQNRVHRRAESLFDELGFHLDPDRLGADFPPRKDKSSRSPRPYGFGPALLILDEPTSSLSSYETDLVLAAIGRVKARGELGHLHLSSARRGDGSRRSRGRAEGWRSYARRRAWPLHPRRPHPRYGRAHADRYLSRADRRPWPRRRSVSRSRPPLRRASNP